MNLFKNRIFLSTPSSTGESTPESFSGRGMKTFTVGFSVGIIGFFMLRSGAEETLFASPVWLLEPLLYTILLLGIWVNRKYGFRKRFSLSRWGAAFLFIGLSIVTRMFYETSLAFGPEGIGWAHYEPFILHSIIYAIIGYFLIRKFCFTFQDVFFISGAVSLFEAFMFGYLFPLSLFTPFILAYYFLVYALYLCIPLIFIDEKLLWRKEGSCPQIRMIWKIVLGVLMGLASWTLPGVFSWLLPLFSL